MIYLYEWIGFIFSWLGFFIGFLVSLNYLYKVIVIILNLLGKKYKNLWYIIEYVYYRKDFKDWVKDKERLNRFEEPKAGWRKNKNN